MAYLSVKKGQKPTIRLFIYLAMVLFSETSTRPHSRTNTIFDSMPTLPKQLQRPWVYHSAFWLCFFLFNVVRWGSYFNDYAYSIKSNLLGFSIHMVLCYLNAYMLVPYFVPRKQYGRYALLLALALAVMFFVKVGATYLLIRHDVWPEAVGEVEIMGFDHVVAVVVGELYVIGITTSIKLMMDWTRSQRRARALEQEKVQAELGMLKAQIHPHFFFNTLNNLYALTLENSPEAPETVLRLSELMSYILYQKQDLVPLEEEVRHLEHYIELERLRFGDRLRVEFHIEGEVRGHYLPTLLLLPLVENAFKHGTKNQLKEIDLQLLLRVEEGWLHFSTSNPVATVATSRIPLQNEKGGIGLSNTRRRLELLFKDQYTFLTSTRDTRYEVSLSIPSNT